MLESVQSPSLELEQTFAEHTSGQTKRRGENVSGPRAGRVRSGGFTGFSLANEPCVQGPPRSLHP